MAQRRRRQKLRGLVSPSPVGPAIVKVGLPDIMLPVNTKHAVDHAMQNRDEVIRLTRELGLVGVQR